MALLLRKLLPLMAQVPVKTLLLLLPTFSDVDILLQDTNSTDYGPSGEKCCIHTMSICVPLLCSKCFSKEDDFSCLSECVGVICKYYKDNGYDDGCIKPYRDSCKKKKKPVNPLSPIDA